MSSLNFNCRRYFRRWVFSAAFLVVISGAGAADGGSAGASATTEALPLAGFSGMGAYFAHSNRLDQLEWTDAQVAAFVEGVRSALRRERVSFDDEATRRVGADLVRRVQQLGEGATPAREAVVMPAEETSRLLKDARKRFRLQEAGSGLLHAVKSPGHGARPRPEDTVTISIHARSLADDTPLAELSGEHARVKVAELIPGLREGVQMMAVGSEAVFVLPPALAFGEENGPAGVPRGQPLRFEVTLEDVAAAR